MLYKGRVSNGLWTACLGLLCGIFFGWGREARFPQRRAVLFDLVERSEMHRRLIWRREKERLQLAQQLHDGPVQDLHALSFHLHRLEMLPHQTRRVRLITIRAILQQVISVLQTIYSDLWPPTLVVFGLAGAIRSHAERLQQAHPELKIRLDLMADDQVLPAVERAVLFRIYQQLLDNAIKHAHAGTILVQFILHTEDVVLQVQDDGCGFEVPRQWLALIRRGRLGLPRAGERAKALGGYLNIISTPGKGTVVQVIVPRFPKKEAAPF